MKQINSLSHRDWSYIRRINKQIKLKNKKHFLKKIDKNKVLEENREKDCQAIEELPRICCEERDRARQLRIDALSVQQEENPSTVNQLLAQIQELQDKVNSLDDAKEFFGPKTASSSGMSHVAQSTLEFSESQRID